jgi:hypothetical protein
MLALSRLHFGHITHKDYSMKRTRIVPSSSPVTTIRVAGKAYHYCHTKALGKIRAIIISPDENLPSRPGEALNDLQQAFPELFAEAPHPAKKSHADMVNDEIDLYEQESAKKTPSKGQKLEMLMDCDIRLFNRFSVYWENLQAASDNESKAYWLARATRVQRAMTRLTRKIDLLLAEG